MLRGLVRDNFNNLTFKKLSYFLKISESWSDSYLMEKGINHNI